MKVGVIGTGKMGENHVRTYLSLPHDCELVGIFDSDRDRSLKVSEKYNVKQFLSMDELLQQVDAVSIAVPTEFHYDIGLTCIKHKTHMLMEKPITNTVEEADDLIKRANNRGVKLQIGHIELFNPLIHLLKKELEQESIIGISFVRLNPYDERVKDVHVVKDLMIHDLYILKELTEDHFIECHALGYVKDDTTKHATAIIESTQGVVAELVASFQSKRKVRMIQVVAKDAFIEADLLNNKITMTRSSILDAIEVQVPLTKTIQMNENTQPLPIQLLDFINCVKYDKLPTVSGEQGKWALEITEDLSKAIHKS